ncbi:hypothetical protein, partial [Lentzea sp. NPDC060358]|uniref:hypothetical protein n=1 Tax=Lentzea sp. NPDC060358 TaxID=3347103 RepID=UPI00364BC1BA
MTATTAATGIGADAEELRARAARTDEVVAALPPVPDRSPEQRELARAAHRAARFARSEFLRVHAD